MKKCPFCAEKIKSEAIKCKFCNEFLGGQNKESGQSSEKSSDKSIKSNAKKVENNKILITPFIKITLNRSEIFDLGINLYYYLYKSNRAIWRR